MEKKLLSFLFSTRLMAVLFLTYAGSMAAGTFIEDAYNTDTARILIYNSWWFEAIHVFFLINFFGNIKRYQLYKKEKWATLLLHLSFILILIGSCVTRYIGYEGMMPIREGASEKVVYSDKTYLTVMVDGQHNGEMKRRTFQKQLLLSDVVNNNFSINDKFSEIPFEISYSDFIMGAKETIKKDDKGVLYLKMVEAGSGGREEHFLKEGEVQSIHNILYALNKFTQGAINITIKDNVYSIQTPFEGKYMRMADKLTGNVVKNATAPLMMRSLYTIGEMRFVFPELAIKGSKAYISNHDYKDKKNNDALVLNIKSQGKEDKVTLLGSKGNLGEPQVITQGSLDYTLQFGSKVYELPFKIKLNKFIAQKYPGTEKSYSSFESKVTVQDKTNFDARIYMNHVLDYNGYRFFQSSFDEDEKGTKLSVNHDFWGTWITYFGYFLLYFAMMAILFDKNTRFNDIKLKLEKVKAKKASLMTILLLLLSFSGFSQVHNHQKPTQKQLDSLLTKYTISEEHAAQFGRLVIQDDGGRMKPINTFASELLRKVSKNDSYKNMNADQVFISMTQFPEVWYEIPLVYLKRNNDSLRKIIGIDVKSETTSLISFFDERGNYKFKKQLEEANKAPIPNQFQKDFIDTDKKVNLLYAALSGQILKIFPYPKAKNNKWVSYLEVNQPTGTILDTVKNILPVYLKSLDDAAVSKDYKLANSLLTGMQNYQKKFGDAVMPSDKKIDSEILYNKYNIFKNLFVWYMCAGMMMFLFVIINIFDNRKWVTFSVNFFHIVLGILFVLHTIGLIARSYISGHAPWTDAYESMIYVGWSIMFFGLAFGRNSKLTVASTSFVASMILMIAHLNWLDPSIANLKPVLDSYWLMIHVAVIVASYGPFALGMILGLVALFLMLISSKKNKTIMDLNIQEITYINELALTVGLVMLTIGNFLGGQWANESWGRYWGWDPKETWALITIMVYAFVIHMRFVPALRGKFIYNFMSVLAFASVLMTYFGVNFHLSGMHSYASGERQNVQIYLYILLIFLVFSGIVFFRYKQFNKDKS
jgi:cytochrome c-type biogenesis protein CcsB